MATLDRPARSPGVSFSSCSTSCSSCSTSCCSCSSVGAPADSHASQRNQQRTLLISNIQAVITLCREEKRLSSFPALSSRGFPPGPVKAGPLVSVTPSTGPGPGSGPGSGLGAGPTAAAMSFRVPKDFPHSRFSRAPLAVYPPKGARPAKPCLEKITCLNKTDTSSPVRLNTSSSSGRARSSPTDIPPSSSSSSSSSISGPPTTPTRAGGKPSPARSPLSRRLPPAPSPSPNHRRASPSRLPSPMTSPPPPPQVMMSSSSPAPPPPDRKQQNGTKATTRPHRCLSGRVFDPNKHCGVQDPETKRQCTRSLTCKHKGRAKQEKEAQEEAKREREKERERERPTPPAPQTTAPSRPHCANGRLLSTLKLRLANAHIPRVPGSSSSSASASTSSSAPPQPSAVAVSLAVVCPAPAQPHHAEAPSWSAGGVSHDDEEDEGGGGGGGWEGGGAAAAGPETDNAGGPLCPFYAARHPRPLGKSTTVIPEALKSDRGGESWRRRRMRRMRRRRWRSEEHGEVSGERALPQGAGGATGAVGGSRPLAAEEEEEEEEKEKRGENGEFMNPPPFTKRLLFQPGFDDDGVRGEEEEDDEDDEEGEEEEDAIFLFRTPRTKLIGPPPPPLLLSGGRVATGPPGPIRHWPRLLCLPSATGIGGCGNGRHLRGSCRAGTRGRRAADGPWRRETSTGGVVVVVVVVGRAREPPGPRDGAGSRAPGRAPTSTTTSATHHSPLQGTRSQDVASQHARAEAWRKENGRRNVEVSKKEHRNSFFSHLPAPLRANKPSPPEETAASDPRLWICNGSGEVTTPEVDVRRSGVGRRGGELHHLQLLHYLPDGGGVPQGGKEADDERSELVSEGRPALET
ncbi:hypothetical protein CRUP_015140 [Coryphaenoides rupestris]|nr:hypothetical protein CRUP_015140 [Coryphaenoides rupestris]